MDNLFRQRAIIMRDIDVVYESLFLRSVTGFEVFLQDQFIDILKGNARYPRTRVSVLITAKTNDALMSILLQGGRYMTWLPFSNTEDRAKLYLKEGRPFTDLTNGDKSMIGTITTTRNAIAHKSEHAMREFNRIVIGAQALLPRERSPAGYLRSPVRASSATNRFQIYERELARIANALT